MHAPTVHHPDPKQDHLPSLGAPVHACMSGPGALWRDERRKRPRPEFSRLSPGDDACRGGVSKLRIRGCSCR